MLGQKKKLMYLYLFYFNFVSVDQTLLVKHMMQLERHMFKLNIIFFKYRFVFSNAAVPKPTGTFLSQSTLLSEANLVSS